MSHTPSEGLAISSSVDRHNGKMRWEDHENSGRRTRGGHSCVPMEGLQAGVVPLCLQEAGSKEDHENGACLGLCWQQHAPVLPLEKKLPQSVCIEHPLAIS